MTQSKSPIKNSKLFYMYVGLLLKVVGNLEVDLYHNKSSAHSHVQNFIVWLYELQNLGYQFKSTSGCPTTYKRSAAYM